MPEEVPMPSIRPVNVQRTFLNQTSPQAQVIYTVPARSLLIIEDASARAVDSATASTAGNPGIVPNVPVHIELRTNPSGTIAWGAPTTPSSRGSGCRSAEAGG
jgi:hypothetical protein